MPVSLDEFERGIAPLTVRQVPEAVRTAKEEYRAYGSVAHATPSILFRVNRENPEPWSFAPYGYMQGGTTDGSGLFISVVFPNHMGVRIHGRNLDELLGLLLAHHVTWSRNSTRAGSTILPLARPSSRASKSAGWRGQKSQKGRLSTKDSDQE